MQEMRMTDCANRLVSIGIPTYNRANSYLKYALRSAVNQTYKNIEIIVSDNCSPDNTEMVVEEFNDPRIRYYRQKENIGPLNNRNFCLEQARGEYFVMLLDDDLIDDDFITVCMDTVMHRGELGVILTGTREIDAGGRVLSAANNMIGGCSTADFILGWFDRKVPLYLCSMVFNTKRLKELGGFHSKTNTGYDDVVAFVQLAAKYGRADIFDIKGSFRRHGSNIGDAFHYSEWCEDSLYLLDVMCNVAPEQASLIRERGMSYFCFRHYSRVAGIKPPVARFEAYRTIYKTFNYSYSPIRYLCVKNIQRIRCFLRKAMVSLQYGLHARCL
jgi:glycosyltransferase involved in cell wall biosynthesis